MGTMYGYAGSILYVDLTNGSVRKEPVTEEMARAFIGGMGINAKLAYDLIKPGIDPLSAENVLIYGAGPFVGTLVPAGSRCDATGKSPLTGFLSYANSGHSIGTGLKYSGYDHLVITGRAERPVYLKIFDDDIEIRDAGHLWGKDVYEATDSIWDELGDCWVSCIGPGGENLVRYACVMTNKWVADRKKFKSIVDELLGRLTQSPAVKLWRSGGWSEGFLTVYTEAGQFATKNWTQGYPDITQTFKTKDLQEMLIGNYACPGCPLGDKTRVQIKQGKYAGSTMQMPAPPSQVAWHVTAGVESWEETFRCVDLEDRYGLDSASLSGVVGFAVELYEKGIITKEDTGGLELGWGGETIRALAKKIVRREDIGDILAEGVKRASEIIGKGSEKYAVHVKGLELALGQSGRFCTETFGELLNPRGGHQDRSASVTFMPRKPASIRKYCPGIGVPEEAMDRVCDGPEGFNPARLTKWVQDFNTIEISLGLCNRTPIAQLFNVEKFAELYLAVTGIEMSPAELLISADRIWNMESAFNVREGATRKDDMPPWRVLNEPLFVRDKQFGPISEETVNKLLDDYYDERGWDIEKGVASEEKLRELGLEGILKE